MVAVHFVGLGVFSIFNDSIKLKRYLDKIVYEDSESSIPNSIHICLIGTGTMKYRELHWRYENTFSEAQLVAAKELILDLLHAFDLKVTDVKGHYEWYSDRQLPLKKIDPYFNMKDFRTQLLKE